MINTDALKDKVLDLALRGLLTTQFKEDGSAQELYESIQEDKKKLFELGKIEKNKIIPITDEDFPYEIPDNWKWIRWGDLSERIQYGYNAPGKQSGRIKLVRISDIQEGKVLWDTVPYCDIEESNIETYLLHENDILFARTGGTVGKSYLVENIANDAVFAGYLIRTSYSNKLCSKYMKYFMDSKLYWKQLQSGTIATAQPNCNAKTLSKMLLPLPPVNEQIRIVNVIDEVFDIIEELEELQEQYEIDKEALKSKLIDAGIRGELTEQLPEDGTAEELLSQISDERKKQEDEGKIKKVDKQPLISDEEIPFMIPHNWKWVRLGDTSYIVRGGSPRPIKQYITNEESGINWIKIGDVEKGGKYILETQEKIIPEGEKKSRKVYPDDFLLTNSMSYGRPYISKIEGCIHDGWLLIHNLNGFDQDYLYYLLSSGYLYSQFIQKASGSTVDNLNIDKVSSAIIPLPPLAEQRRIANRIEELLQYCQ